MPDPTPAEPRSPAVALREAKADLIDMVSATDPAVVEYLSRDHAIALVEAAEPIASQGGDLPRKAAASDDVTALREALTTLFSEVGFMRSCIASGEKLTPEDLTRQSTAMAEATRLLAKTPAPDTSQGGVLPRAPVGELDVEGLANDVRYGGIHPDDYWRGFNDGIDALVQRLSTDQPRRPPGRDR